MWLLRLPGPLLGINCRSAARQIRKAHRSCREEGMIVDQLSWKQNQEQNFKSKYAKLSSIILRNSTARSWEKHGIQSESLSCFRQSFKCYIPSIPGRFPAQKHRAGRLKEYYLLNAASILAVMALDIENEEKVLDMCAAPGGKSIVTLQYACPGLLQSNEYDNLRSNWLRNTLESFIPESLMNLVIISQLDGRQIGNLQPERFDKILVDAPCSNDRSWLFSSDIQQATARLARRKELSSVQIQLLRSAIKALRPGGSLVYSTCTLSKAENSDMITHTLNTCNNVLPVDISTLARAVSKEFSLSSDLQQHEFLILPEMGKAWGPMYISKLKKI
ncbi:tRNA (cytosine(34)-C(5))-methyltransferase, mitochondrial isoform X2 [Sphaerodactylus townsendi]|uniref:tRNA (cytosine(34)-C(5))-methyltransferase, mitochondrial isoform X2 n=1 Tax=Sphaerodactylus townsendi TaxID=933632 RepID=UPI002026916F|nr:tRNA (cytosine(34)-C(5))-methyltransferase, mitochondrial isoform X2 [Sphaerodactylus townsendi]